MQDDKKIIAFSVIFTLVVLLYSNFYGTDTRAEPEPASVGGAAEEILQEKTAPTTEIKSTPTTATETGSTDVPLPLDSFDQAALEQESLGIQEGIDLLGNPLQ